LSLRAQSRYAQCRQFVSPQNAAAAGRPMKALAVSPGKKHSAHIAELPTPTLADAPDPRKGVVVRTLQVGVDATDAEIDEALYGRAPKGYDFLVLGHEVFGVVEEVGPDVTHVKPGDYCTC